MGNRTGVLRGGVRPLTALLNRAREGQPDEAEARGPGKCHHADIESQEGPFGGPMLLEV